MFILLRTASARPYKSHQSFQAVSCQRARKNHIFFLEIHLTSHKSIVYLIPVPLETGKFEADALKKKMKKV